MNTNYTTEISQRIIRDGQNYTQRYGDTDIKAVDWASSTLHASAMGISPVSAIPQNLGRRAAKRLRTPVDCRLQRYLSQQRRRRSIVTSAYESRGTTFTFDVEARTSHTTPATWRDNVVSFNMERLC